MGVVRGDIIIADLNPAHKSEPGKIRPCVVIQTNFLNDIGHTSTIICPITSNVMEQAKFTRVHLKADESGLNKDCDILVDQIRAIHNSRIQKKVGTVSKEKIELLNRNIKIILSI